MKAIAPRRKRLFRREFLVFDEDGGGAATEILLGKRSESRGVEYMSDLVVSLTYETFDI